ncbi:MAG: tetratricopeptide repeat protein [Treponema sp.]|nr:tetratricopeptide repeat protein [Treponema sp.]
MRTFHAAIAALAFALAIAAFCASPAHAQADPRSLGPAQNYFRGRELEATGLMAQATAHYNETVRVTLNEISIGAATGGTYTFLTRALRRLGRHSEAISWGQQGLRLFPSEYAILDAMGQSYFFLGNFEQSLAHMERYASLMPNGDRISMAYFFMGEIFRLQGRFHRADIAYTQAVFFEPGMILWWYRLGSVREEAGDLESAARAYARAVELSPNHAGARAALARIAGN